MTNKADILLGLQWGDEGKGKLVDVLTPQYDIIARFQGGPNAGHTIEFNDIKHVFHTIPSGIFRPDTVNVVGNGVVIDPVTLKREIESLTAIGVDVRKSLLISRKAHLITPTHRLLDRASEQAKGAAKIGSTLRGIGPAYMDKTGRNGLRVGDVFARDFDKKYAELVEKHRRLLALYPDFEYDLAETAADWEAGLETLRSLTVIDSEHYLNEQMARGKKVLAEGAQGALLDIDFGSYPFVTSSNTTAAGASTGLGIAPNRIGDVFGIFKAYCTRVGSGPFPTELHDATGEQMRQTGHEFGATTGRPRRCGWLDLPALRYAIMINGVTRLHMMKADVLSVFDTINVCTHYEVNGRLIDYLPYDISGDDIKPVFKEMKGWKIDLTGLTNEEDLPRELNDYIAFLESELRCPITIVSVGPNRAQTILRKAIAV
jgi:adenylosuccinate synthase